MITYLSEAMALSVKVAIGTFLWFGIIIGGIILIAAIVGLVMKKNKEDKAKIPPAPEAPRRAAPTVTLADYKKEKEDGGTE